jgi:hypothetical protein
VRIVVYADESAIAAVAAAFSIPHGRGFELEILSVSSFSRGYRKKAASALAYLDVDSLGPERARDMGRRLSALEGSAWGILDRSGGCADPAAWFFGGAIDYLGPALLRAGPDAARLAAAADHGALATERDGPVDETAFPGWSALAEDAEARVRFCYAALGDQRGLLERIGEKRLFKLREDFAAYLEPWAKECGGIVWIRESAGSLVLFPPADEGMNPVLAAFRLLLDRALLGYEAFKLEIPLTFRFAFHQGKTMWRPPGSTGTLVSEDVNFVFHLGMKAAGDGYIVASSDCARFIPAFLGDLFAPAGDFEGKSLLASRRFRD